MSDKDNLSLQEKLHLIASKKVNYQKAVLDEAPYGTEFVVDRLQFNAQVAKYAFSFAIGMMIVTVVLILALTKAIYKEPVTLGYSIASDGTVISLPEVDQAHLTDGQIISWASRKAEDLHNLSFVDAERKVKSLKDVFTVSGFDNYQRALVISSLWEVINTNNLVSWAEHTVAPQIVEQGLEGGLYVWYVKMEMQLFIGGGDRSTDAMPIVSTMKVVRTGRSSSTSGLLIDSYLACEKGVVGCD